MELRFAVRLHQVIDNLGRLVVGQHDQLGILEALVQVPELQRLALLERLREGHGGLTSPVGPGLRLLPHRDAFREPPRDAVVRHLQRDDVRQLVPQRFLPAEFARRPGFW